MNSFYILFNIIIEIILVVLPLFLIVAYTTYSERKIIGFMQSRLGPMRVGPFGFFQPIADVIKLFSKENKLIFEDILLKMKSGEKFTVKEIPIDPQLIDKIDKFASIKHILNNNLNDQEKKFELLEEISRDLKNYDLEFRIGELESKFSKDLSESTFNEIRELKKQKNIN